MAVFPKFDLDDSEKEEDVDRNISNFKMARNVFFTLLQGLNVFYVQYFLFYQNQTQTDYLSVYYEIVLAIYLISALVNMSFSIRIFIINNSIKKENYFTTLIIVAGIFIAINTYFSAIKIRSEEFNKYSLIEKVVYTLIFTPVLLFLQITSFMSQVLVTKYIVQAKTTKSEDKKKEFYELILRYEADAGLLSILDCYLRAAPQMIFNIAFLLKGHYNPIEISGFQISSILVAVVMMPWSITSFQGCIKMEKNRTLTWKTKVFYFLWHFCSMISRILSTAAVIAFWPNYTGVMILTHCLASFLWLWFETEVNEFCDFNKIWHFLFCIVFACVYFFNPMNLVKKRTFWKYSIFYTIVFIQNTVACFFWYFQEDQITNEWKICFIVAISVNFVGGICFMILYYVVFHPNENISLLRNNETVT